MIVDPQNLLADATFPILRETVPLAINQGVLAAGSVIAYTPGTDAVLATAVANLYGILSEQVDTGTVAPPQLGVVYTTGCFIGTSLVFGTGLTLDVAKPVLRGLGIHVGPSVRYG
jgi:hypothetical protein